MNNRDRILNATTTHEILQALAHAIWQADQPGTEIPAARLARANLPAIMMTHVNDILPIARQIPGYLECAESNPEKATRILHDALDARTVKLHKDWIAAGDKRGKHPAAGAVRFQIYRPVDTVPHRVPASGIMSVPDFHRAVMPDFASGTDMAVPSWLLRLFEHLSGESLAGQRTAPMPLHMMIGAIVSLPIEDRDGHFRTLQFPHLIEHETAGGPASVERWLFPDGWDRYDRVNRGHWKQLRDSLYWMRRNLAGICCGSTDFEVIRPTAIPLAPDEPLVEFTLRVPAAASHGTRVDFRQLSRYRTQSFSRYKALLIASEIIGNSAINGHGLTRQIQRKDGKVVNNPAVELYTRCYADEDLARLLGHNPADRRLRKRARETFDKLAADGAIDLYADRGGYRILAPRRKPWRSGIM